ncbi:solute carrier family 15 member 3-like [Sycon ciliatum]|uniref:solute carrier family 15 member 3-like n=1 Tax=Sycon ciliatum TaxID=27933 RepID=UPI0031F6CF66
MSDEATETTRLVQSSRSRAQEASGDETRKQSLTRCQRLHPSYFVIAIAAVERLGQNGILTNLVLFMQNHRLLDWSTSTVNIVVLLVRNVTLLLAAVSGAVTDSQLSRYAMLYVGVVLQLLGCSMMTAAAFLEHHDEYDPDGNVPTLSPLSSSQDHLLRSLILGGLGLLSIGRAAALGAEVPLGVDQYWRRRESTEKASQFFPLYYFWINVSSTVVIGALSYVQLNYGFRVGLAPSTGAYLLCLLGIHALRSRLYSTENLGHGGGLKNVISAYKAAWLAWREERKRPQSGAGARRRRGSNVNMTATDQWIKPTPWLCYADLSEKFREEGGSVTDARNFTSLVLVLLPILLYNVMMSQIATTFVSQGDAMSISLQTSRNDAQRNVSGNTTGDGMPPFIPSTLIAAVSGIAIIVAIPLLYGVVYPRLDSARRFWRLTLFRRMGIGMFVAVLSVLCAAVVEVERRQDDRWNATSRYDPALLSTHTASSLSIFWQVPQYILSGIAEVMVYLSALEFAYCKSPSSMKGLSIGLVYAMSGLSGLLSALILYLLSSNDSRDFYGSGSPGRMHLYYAALGGLILLGIFFFGIATKRYKFVQRRGGGGAGAAGGAGTPRDQAGSGRYIPI